MEKKYVSIFVIIIMLGIAACQSNRQGQNTISPSDILPKETFVSVLVEAHLAEAALRGAPISSKDSTLQTTLPEAYAFIFEKHHIQAQDFEKTMQYYTQHPDDFLVVYDLVMEKLAKMSSQMPAKIDTLVKSLE
ncbi:MAG: DUF4296 domain-containing protein [Chitinophagales bacterium]|nr:DUF4296 domain-containing protein [Bacteroidota bacterium]MCB9043598.1 DUF4296 domain-containing protein [Chitinophagales bacterium]